MTDSDDSTEMDERNEESEAGEDKKAERSASLGARFNTESAADTPATESNAGEAPNKTEDTISENTSGPPPVRERLNRSMYAGEAVFEEIDIRYEELSLQYRREFGEKLPKNAVFYPALLRAGVRGTSLEVELGLVNDSEQ